MSAAVQKQFGLVLGRVARNDELERYINHTLESIKAAGNTEGLRQMLVSVLLESEFLYRMEFGVGESDTHGRRKLQSHAAAQTIAYALGDRGPDVVLRKAAEEGRLSSQEDYRREVARLLADDSILAGPVDPGLSGKNMRTHESTHPKLVRFFASFLAIPTPSRSLRIFLEVMVSGRIHLEGLRVRPASWSKKLIVSWTGFLPKINMSLRTFSPQKTSLFITTKIMTLVLGLSKSGPRSMSILRTKIGRVIQSRSLKII